MSSKPELITQKMLKHDSFSAWLGIELETIGEGTCTLALSVRPEMVNGFGVAHGGISYALADSAFAFACNSFGLQSLSIETSISHCKTIQIGDRLQAVATVQQNGKRVGTYYVEIRNQHNDIVALFKGTCYKTAKEWEV
ncbi:MAG: hotdog fold thioesterase [Sphingobacteriales bacterium]|nr:hotdog fold thioesterase [Sphingobacteriales bacterium]